MLLFSSDDELLEYIKEVLEYVCIVLCWFSFTFEFLEFEQFIFSID
jgi:hypothetical protein